MKYKMTAREAYKKLEEIIENGKNIKDNYKNFGNEILENMIESQLNAYESMKDMFFKEDKWNIEWQQVI